METPAPPPPAPEPPSKPAAPPAAAPAGEPHRRAEDVSASHPAARRRKRRRATSDNLTAFFLLCVLVGCAGIWIEAQRCPGAFDTAGYAGAPSAIAVGVVLAGLIALGPKGLTRSERISRGVVYGLWASLASLAITTAGLLVLNERGPAPTSPARCWVERRETHPARNAGVEEWIVVLRCSDRMSLVPVDVDRHTWWENEPGSSVQATLAKGALGYAWVVETSIGPPKRLLP